MRILAVGGGSGGHVTPVVAVLRELRRHQPDTTIHFWCDRKFAHHAQSIVAHFDENLVVETIYSGKFRRFNNLSLWRQLTRPNIIFPNMRDGFFTVIGFGQSIIKLISWRPDVIFTKGGFVCLPVGLAARLLSIPLVIHDSDAHPGLTNRVLAKWATSIATGAPLEHYNYPSERARYVGIPVASQFKPFSALDQQQAKLDVGVSRDRPLIVVTGGGLGATRINDAVVKSLDSLLEFCSVILISGSNQYDELAALTPNYRPSDFQLHAFVSEGLYTMLGAADVVVARAGATTLLELAALAKPTILVPNGYLTGGHQLKNAAVYAEKDAVVVVDEHKLDSDSTILVKGVREVLNDTKHTEQMTRNFHKFARPDAASDVADMILAAAK